jgi:enolase
MIKIKNIKIRNILNSDGKPTIEVEMIAENNLTAMASSPSAIIPGKREVKTTNKLEEDKLKEMIGKICDKEIENQKQLDHLLTTYIEDLGTNICLPFSLAFARLMAKAQKLTLVHYIASIANCQIETISPIPLVTIFSGGIHQLEEKGSIQNIMIAVNVHPFSKAVKQIIEIYTDIEDQVKKENKLKTLGSSSGMIVENMTVEEKFTMIQETIKKLGYEKEVSIAIDVAAEHFFKNGVYCYQGKEMNAKELNVILNEYSKKYPITYIEDPFDASDEYYWKKMKTEQKNIHIVGDDLFATQDKYIDSELANGIIIKMNQVGTLTETLEAVSKAKKENMVTCVSQRSIETEDTFMCDLAVALTSNYIKIGGPRRGDRIAKYNRLLRLEE